MSDHKTIQLTDADMADVTRLQSLAGNGGIEHHHLVDSRRKQGETRGQKYERYITAVKDLASSNDPRVAVELGRVNRTLAALNPMRTKDVAPSTVHSNTTLSNLSVQYANDDYIGLELMPLLQVAKESDSILDYAKRDRLQSPDDTMPSRGEANEINETRSNDSYTCLQYGLSNFVSARTLSNQDAPFDEMVDLVEALNELLAFNEEKRIAAAMVATANYAGNTAAIAAGDRWDTAGGGNPIKKIQDGRAAMWSGRGPGDVVAFTSIGVYNVLSRHPQILDLFKYNGSSPGLATPDMIAKFFDMTKLYVGKARKDTAVEGQTASYSRIWSDVFGMVRVAKRASLRNASFGYTLRHGQKLTQVQFDPMKGHGGGYKAQVTLSETHKVIAGDAAYLWTTPIG